MPLRAAWGRCFSSEVYFFMADIRPFRACRPAQGLASEIAALPYDVYSRTEAREYVAEHPGSFLAIDRAETTLSPDVDIYDDRVYEHAGELLSDWIRTGRFIQDEIPCYYIYAQTMKGRTQTGIVACASIDDYNHNVIKKHENTRADKEQDRIRHVDACSAQTGPIFLCYRGSDAIREVVARVTAEPCAADFISEGDIRNRVWVISDPQDCSKIHKAFKDIDSIYIADGHHRCASAVRVGELRRQQNPGFTGEEDFNFFLSVLFPEEELKIMDYNRVIHDLNGLTPQQFLEKAGRVCEISPVSSGSEADSDAAEHDHNDINDIMGKPAAPSATGSQTRMTEAAVPKAKGSMGMYLDGKWYLLRFRPEFLSDDPVDGLDVSLLQNHILAPVLGIHDPKKDTRIEFVGGIRGTKPLEEKADSFGGVSFLMYPTSIGELFAVADAGLLMPPKSTWFEPKLLSGLFIHRI